MVGFSAVGPKPASPLPAAKQSSDPLAGIGRAGLGLSALSWLRLWKDFAYGKYFFHCHPVFAGKEKCFDKMF